MKKYLFLCLALVCSNLAQAQQNRTEVVTVFLKSGQKIVLTSWAESNLVVFAGGNFNQERVYDSTGPEEYNSWEQLQTLAYYHADGFEGQLSDLQRISSGIYLAAMAWQYPDDFATWGNATTGLCFGTSKDLTVENCENVFELNVFELNYVHANYSMAMVGTKSVLPAEKERYMRLRVDDSGYSNKTFSLEDLYKDNAWFDCNLVPGKTYYYRPFIAVRSFENTGEKVLMEPQVSTTPTYLYGDVASFRVPKLVTDFGYEEAHDGGYYPQQSLDDFATAHADHKLTHALYVAGILRPYLIDYLDTPEARASFDLTNKRVEKCDNGTITIVENIPDAFCTWLEKAVVPQEIVVNSLKKVVPNVDDGRSSSSQWTTYESNMTWETVTDVDPSWGVPGNQYMLFQGKFVSRNPMVSFDFSNALPGKYKIVATFAPNTTIENIEEAIPTKMKVWAYGRGDDGQMEMQYNDPHTTALTPGVSDFIEASGKETSTIVICPEYELNCVGFYLKLQVERSTIERMKNLYDNTLRVAEIRLIPVTE